MLTLVEKVIFLAWLIVTLFIVWQAVQRLRNLFARGGSFDWPPGPGKGLRAAFNSISLAPVFRDRFSTSLMHALVAWGFLYFLLVNTAYLLEGFIPDFHFSGRALREASISFSQTSLQ